MKMYVNLLILICTGMAIYSFIDGETLNSIYFTLWTMINIDLEKRLNQ